MSKKLRVYCCEDDPRTRRLLAKIIDSTPELELVGQAANAEDALAALQPAASTNQAGAPATPDRAGAPTSTASAGPPADVLLLDLELPGMQGMELLEQLEPPPAGPEVLILTSFADEDRVFSAMRRGAAGYLVKGGAAARLVEAIREVNGGGSVIEPRLARRFWNLFQASVGRTSADPYGLSPREREVLALMAKGLTNPELGSVLSTGTRSIKLTLETLYEKMGVQSRVEAVVAGVKAGLITL
jgi:DNA-binding NarL/FixJ family response regulator